MLDGSATPAQPLLAVRGLKKHYHLAGGKVLKAVDGCAHLGKPPPGARGCPVGEKIPLQVARAITAADKAAADRLSQITVADLLKDAA